MGKFEITEKYKRLLIDRVAKIQNNNIESIYKNNLERFNIEFSDNSSFNGQQSSIATKAIALEFNIPFAWEYSKNLDGFELNELDFIGHEFSIIEKGRHSIQEREITIKKQLAIYESYLNQRKTSLSQKPQQSNKVSFIWQNNAEKELPELFSLMLDKYKLIALETTLEQFTAIFTGQPIETIEPVKWHQDNASELLYFYIQLSASTNIDGNPNKLNYQKLVACFVKPDGQPYEASFKQLKTHIEINLSDEKKNNISSLIKEF
jgi:hypothetical protein